MRLALTNIFYYLVVYPEHLRQVRNELAQIDWRDYKALARLDHLSAVIYETLRLNPAVPAAGLRITPPEGLTLSAAHIPGGTTVLVPQYSLFRGKYALAPPNRLSASLFQPPNLCTASLNEELTLVCLRPAQLRTAERLPSRAFHHPAGAHPRRGCVHAVECWEGPVHRQKALVAGDSSRGRRGRDEVRCWLRTG